LKDDIDKGKAHFYGQAGAFFDVVDREFGEEKKVSGMDFNDDPWIILLNFPSPSLIDKM